ncbi:MAG TPA: hypothetical protein PLB05_01300 [Candidatus Omnitrophota bacterium]|jgi:hypothetical protein|nr:hypothetical protein [Candidatus Omnitrophota bacterium]HPN55767.1 hypothetical protein [Candidatus Omnitrophota bacterium]
MPVFLSEPMLVFAVCLGGYLLPAAVYTFYLLKWKRAQAGMPGKPRRDNVEAWWDLVMGQEGISPGAASHGLSSLRRKKKRWFIIMILSWLAGTVILIRII